MWLISKNNIKITLKQAIDLKDYIEKKWNKTYAETIIKNNNHGINSSELTKLDVQHKWYSKFLCELHVLIIKANMLKGPGEKYCNNYNIKLRSELNLERILLEKLDTPAKSKDLFISFQDKQQRLRNIHGELSILDAKLSKFNLNIKVEIPNDSKLYELYRSAGITI